MLHFFTFGKDWNGLFPSFLALHKGRPLRNIHFLPACLSGSRLGHNPFSFVHWALGPWGRNSGQESDSFLDSVARLGQQTMFVRHWMGGYGKKKECLIWMKWLITDLCLLLSCWESPPWLVRGGVFPFICGSSPILRAVSLNNSEKELLLWFL